MRHLKLHCHAAPRTAAHGTLLALKVPLPSAIPSLASFDYSVAGGMELAGAVLLAASYRSAPAAVGGPFPVGSSAATLAVGRISRMQQQGGLGQLLTALLPPGGRLDCLLLDHCALQPHTALLGCACLEALPALQLHFCTGCAPEYAFGGNHVASALGPVLSQATQLTALDLQGRLTATGELPPALATKRGLRWLRLRQNHLESMEAGPWLQSLQTLDIGGGNFVESRALPAELEGAPRLRDLRLATNSAVPVRRADVSLLLSMPELTFLSIGVRMAPGVHAALKAAAPSLETVQPAG